MENNEQNVVRADKRIGSVFSILIFVFVFTMGYLFYPQLSMLVPFLGENVSKTTNYRIMGIADLASFCPVIVTARVESIGKTQAAQGDKGVDVSAPVTLKVLETLRGESEETLVLTQYGGSALIRNKKYNVTYPDEAQFEQGTTYLLFLRDGAVFDGRFGAIRQNEDGTFTDGAGWTYEPAEIRAMLSQE